MVVHFNSYSTITGMVPESYRKVLNNIRKTEERSKRKKQAGDTKDDSEEEEPKKCIKKETLDVNQINY